MTLKELIDRGGYSLVYYGEEWQIFANNHCIKIDGRTYVKGFTSLENLVESIAGKRVGPNKHEVIDVPEDLVVGKL